jgi:ATP dependent DNA ligase C terminal region
VSLNSFLGSESRKKFQSLFHLHYSPKNCRLSVRHEGELGRLRLVAGDEGLTAADMAKCIWLKPRLVAAVEYAEWTPANHLRHSKFIALRADKDAREVIRENRS